jgi:integrase
VTVPDRNAETRPVRHSPGLLAKLVASVRPEFRGEYLVFEPTDVVFGGAMCQVTGCDNGRQDPCFGHYYRWVRSGRPKLDHFATTTTLLDPGRTALLPSREYIDLRQLNPQLRLEVQYAIQRRGDEASTKTLPGTVQQAVNVLAASAVTSLLDRCESDWRQRLSARSHHPSYGFMIYALRQVEDLHNGRGWQVEYQRDAWRLRDLGVESGCATHVYFDRIPQPWLRELAKRWARWRISSGMGGDVTTAGIRAVTRFSQFLVIASVGERLDQIDRALLERYLADLRAELGARPVHRDHIGQLNTFFTAIRQHRWASLPDGAMFFTEDYPKPEIRLPRALAEHVMAQIEDPDNLDRWDNPTYRLITLVLIQCGLRISDALRLPPGCVVHDADNAPYLRYYNHKMKREALVPIDEHLEQEISQQRQRLRQRWKQLTPVLFPRPTKNVSGSQATCSSTYRRALSRWLTLCNVRDEYGTPVRLTPHQWRHTLGTRLINRDVPQEVVRIILDHDSHVMTAHYARLHDTTVRRHWEAARKVNINGQAVTIDPDGPLAEAAWVRQRIDRATQALPNGCCGLPVQKTCPHANACLTCPMFITTPEYLPQHHQHREQTIDIITVAETRGQTRLVEMNQRVLLNLNRIITTLEETGQENVADAI